MMACRIDSEWMCSVEERLAQGLEGDVQVLSIGKRGHAGREIRLVNVYDQRRSIEDGFRPARHAPWDTYQEAKRIWQKAIRDAKGSVGRPFLKAHMGRMSGLPFVT
jgi:hypothetical protein